MTSYRVCANGWIFGGGGTIDAFHITVEGSNLISKGTTISHVI